LGRDLGYGDSMEIAGGIIPGEACFAYFNKIWGISATAS